MAHIQASYIQYLKTEESTKTAVFQNNVFSSGRNIVDITRFTYRQVGNISLTYPVTLITSVVLSISTIFNFNVRCSHLVLAWIHIVTIRCCYSFKKCTSLSHSEIYHWTWRICCSKQYQCHELSGSVLYFPISPKNLQFQHNFADVVLQQIGVSSFYFSINM